jgi:hypothetical protein
MALVNCPECDKRVEREAGICMECGAELGQIVDSDEQRRRARSGMNLGLGIMVLTVPFIGVSGLNMGLGLIAAGSVVGLVLVIVNKRRLNRLG